MKLTLRDQLEAPSWTAPPCCISKDLLFQLWIFHSLSCEAVHKGCEKHILPSRCLGGRVTTPPPSSSSSASPEPRQRISGTSASFEGRRLRRARVLRSKHLLCGTNHTFRPKSLPLSPPTSSPLSSLAQHFSSLAAVYGEPLKLPLQLCRWR